uniref:Uncharacterized protein n=1 Tax=Panagrellus redivivus TaxID=6233 RepID=A0A7E4VYW0_PANRE
MATPSLFQSKKRQLPVVPKDKRRLHKGLLAPSFYSYVVSVHPIDLYSDQRLSPPSCFEPLLRRSAITLSSSSSTSMITPSRDSLMRSL